MGLGMTYAQDCYNILPQTDLCATLLQALVAAGDSALTTGSPTFPGICSSSSTLEARISICMVL